MSKVILITGTAGFIGYHLSKRILEEQKDTKVIGLDNVNDYYDVALKHARLSELSNFDSFTFIKADLADKDAVDEVFETHRPDIVVNLAAQAGVRYSLTNPEAYIHSNIVGFFNILEACRHYKPEHLIYASSSSVYGSNKKTPFATTDMTDTPLSLYAATKKSNELMAHSYSSLYGVNMTGLRFFTVYGPYGRPDMAMYIFTDKMAKGEPVTLFNNGDMERDFTYVDDVVEGIVRIIDKPPSPSPAHKVYNIGNNSPEKLTDFVDTLERVLLEEGVISSPAKREYLPMQPGDVYATYADTSELERDFGYKPYTRLEDGVRRFVLWYKDYHK